MQSRANIRLVTTARWRAALAGVALLAVGVAAGLVVAPTKTETWTTTVTSPDQPGSAPAPQPETPSDRPAQGSKLSFSGTGPRALGTVQVTRAGTIRWTSEGGGLKVVYGSGQLVLNSTGRSGRIFAPAGTYRHVRVIAPGHWTLRVH